MPTVDEIPQEPYAEIVRALLAAGAPVPERLGETGPASRHSSPSSASTRRG
jgi:hypothetical protein